VILALVSLVILLALMHSRFRTTRGSFMRAAAFAAAAVSGFLYFQQASAPPIVIPPIACPLPKQNTKDPLECYEPGDFAQFSRHLRECKIVPGGSHRIDSAPAADSRGVPCDYFDQFENHSNAAPPATASR
jgi:hypothetical protein